MNCFRTTALAIVLSVVLTPCLAQQHAAKPATAPAVSLQTLISVIAVDEKASYTVNDWSSLKQTGLVFSIKDNGDHCAKARVLTFGRVSVCYSGPRAGLMSINISKTGFGDGAFGVSSDTLAEDLKKLLGPDTQVSRIRGLCPDDGAVRGTFISSFTIKGRKPLYAYSSYDMGGSAANYDYELTITLNKDDLDKDPLYKCD